MNFSWKIALAQWMGPNFKSTLGLVIHIVENRGIFNVIFFFFNYFFHQYFSDFFFFFIINMLLMKKKIPFCWNVLFIFPHISSNNILDATLWSTKLLFASKQDFPCIYLVHILAKSAMQQCGKTAKSANSWKGMICGSLEIKDTKVVISLIVTRTHDWLSTFFLFIAHL